MLQDGSKIFDADDNMELVLDFDIIKFVHLNRNVSVEGLLENSYNQSAQEPQYLEQSCYLRC